MLDPGQTAGFVLAPFGIWNSRTSIGRIIGNMCGRYVRPAERSSAFCRGCGLRTLLLNQRQLLQGFAQFVGYTLDRLTVLDALRR